MNAEKKDEQGATTEPEWEKDYTGEDDDIYDAVIHAADAEFKRSAVFGKMRAKIASLREELSANFIDKINGALTPVEREMLALAIFTMGMKIGPGSFNHFESIVQKTGIRKEFAENYDSWMAYNKKNGPDK